MPSPPDEADPAHAPDALRVPGGPAGAPAPEALPSSFHETLSRLRGGHAEGPVRASGRAERYVELSEVGKGGMGVVLEVRDLELRRRLAMKRLRGQAIDEGDSFDAARVSRFLEEAQVTGQLEHPGVVPVHELGLDDQGRLFFTMRLVQGRTLAEVIDLARAGQEGYSLARAVGIVLKVCEAVAFAHDKGVIHRDLKPANIMVGRFGETYVMDWGLAKLLGRDEAAPEPSSAQPLTLLTSVRGDESSHGSSSMATLDGDVMGTPAYMPPEQAKGDLPRVGPAADIYAVGAMLFHLLVGRPPLTEEGASPLDVLRRVREGEREPLASLAPGAPPELVAVCSKAMEPEIEARYPSMLALAEELRAWLEGRVVQAYESGAVAEFKKWVARNRTVAAMLAALVVALIGGLAAVLFVREAGRERMLEANRVLAERNDELGRARALAEEASAEAESQAERATLGEEAAQRQSYAAGVAAAGAFLESGSAGAAASRLEACPEALRDLEWHLLARRLDVSERVIEGAHSMVTSIAFAPEGQTFATGGGGPAPFGEYSIALWDAATGELVRRLEGHTKDVIALSFHPYGDLLASRSKDGSVCVWEVETGGLVARRAELPGSGLASMSFDPGGERIAVAGDAGLLVLWDPLEDTLESLDPGIDPRISLTAVTFAPDGESLFVGSVTHDVSRVGLRDDAGNWTIDVLGGKRPSGLGTLDTQRGILHLATEPKGSRLFVATDEGGFVALSARHGEFRETFGSKDVVRAVCLTAGGEWLVTANEGWTLSFFGTRGGTALETLSGHAAPVVGLDASPRGDLLASASLDGSVRLWDARPGASVRSLHPVAAFGRRAFEADGVDVASFSTDGSHLAVYRPDPAYDGGRVVLIDPRSAEERVGLPRFQSPVVGIAWRRAGSELVTVERSGELRVFSSTNGEALTEPIRADPVRARLRHPEASVRVDAAAGLMGLAHGSPEAPRVSIWDLEGPTLVRELVDGAARVLDFTADGSRVLLSTEGGGLELRSVASGELLRAWEGGGWSAMARFTPDESRVVSGSSTQPDLVFHDVENGAEVARWSAPAGTSALAFTPDGTRLLSGHVDNSLALWTLAGDLLVSFRDHAAAVTRIDVAPAGDVVVSADVTGVVRIRDTRPTDPALRLAVSRRAEQADAAQDVIERLEEKWVGRDELLAALSAEEGLSDELREATRVRLLASCENPLALGNRAAGTVIESDATPAEYLLALRCVERALFLRPNDADILQTAGIAHYRMGHYDEALEFLERALALRSGTSARPHATALLFLAMTQAELGMTDAARDSFERGLTLQASKAVRKKMAELTEEARTRVGG